MYLAMYVANSQVIFKNNFLQILLMKAHNHAHTANYTDVNTKRLATHLEKVKFDKYMLISLTKLIYSYSSKLF